MSKRLFTSESVTEGHPDKIADAISDAVLDSLLSQDKKSRVAVETLITTGQVHVAGEVTTDGYADVMGIVRDTVLNIGYDSSDKGFDGNSCGVSISIGQQSQDIAQGVDAASDKDEGAGDQGIMFGYACRETPDLMPAPIYYSHKILKLLSDARRSGVEKHLGPDSKSQVTIRYENGKPVCATQIVVSHQHVKEDLTSGEMQEIIRPYVEKALPQGWINKDTVWHINPTGKFFIGGPDGDTGLTGRKIIVDTYGGAAPHGGGAFSGKDPTKVDRSAAYAARYLAKNVVAAGLADRCTLQLAYAIGVARPLSIYADLHDTGKVDPAKLESILMDIVSLTPRGIREHLKLNRPIYARTSAYGHFGRAPDADGGFSWEKTDLIDELKSKFS